MLEVVKFLLKKRCSTNIPNKKGETAQNIPLNEDGDCLLHIACLWGDVGIIRHLMKGEKCNPNLQSCTTENTPLHIAIEHSSTAAISELLAHPHCEVNIQNKKGNTPLHVAVECGQMEIVFQLMSCKHYTPNVWNRQGLHSVFQPSKEAAHFDLFAPQQCDLNATTRRMILLYTLLAEKEC